MWFLWLVGLVAILGSVVTVGVLSDRYRDRWGTRRGSAVRAGESPYREAPTRDEVPRGVPGLVRFAAATGIAWGLLTLLIFMPAGFLFTTVVADGFGSGGGGGVAVAAVLLVSIDAIAVAFALMGSARAVMRGDDEGRRTARAIAAWSSGHHFAVILAFMLVTAMVPQLFAVLLFALVPCFAGLGQAWALREAADFPGNGAQPTGV